MRTIYINTGYACGLNCLTCPVSEGRSTRDNTVSPLQPLLSQVGECKGDQIYIVGGDPVLRQDLPLIIEAASMNGNYVSMYTPGVRLADMTVLLALTHAGLKHISVPIFSHLHEVHDAITRTEASLARTSEGLRNILSLRKDGTEIDAEIAVTITSLNYAQLPKTVAFISAEFKPKKIMIVQLGSSGRVSDNRDMFSVNIMANTQPLLHAVEVCHRIGQEMSIHEMPLCWMDRKHFNMLAPLSCGSSGVVTDGVTHGPTSKRSRESLTPSHGSCSKCAMKDGCSMSHSEGSDNERDDPPTMRGKGAVK